MRPTEQELTRLLKANQEKYYRMAYAYVKNREDALDIVHDAIVKALQKVHQVKSPMYLETLQAMVDARVNSRLDYQKYWDRALKRAQKFALILERFISPEGTFPVFGRSTPYRLAAMQPLALLAWYQRLPQDLSNGQVRAALTKVMHRMFDTQDNYNEAGFLTIGFCGSQPNVADIYTNNGSLYMASLAFMPLGLPADALFWTDAPQPWTQVKAWGGEDFPKDHAYYE